MASVVRVLSGSGSTILGKNGIQLSCDMFARLMSSSSSPKTIGFIGLGNMGGHMVNNLMKQVNVGL